MSGSEPSPDKPSQKPAETTDDGCDWTDEITIDADGKRTVRRVKSYWRPSEWD